MTRVSEDLWEKRLSKMAQDKTFYFPQEGSFHLVIFHRTWGPGFAFPCKYRYALLSWCGSMRRPDRKICLYLFVLLLPSIPLFFQAADSQTTTFKGKVVGVSDGDTISVMREGRAGCLHGIDCPERGQPFGTKAKRFTSEWAFAKRSRSKSRPRTGTDESSPRSFSRMV